MGITVARAMESPEYSSATRQGRARRILAHENAILGIALAALVAILGGISRGATVSPSNVSNILLQSAIRGVDEDVVAEVKLFDVYRGEQVPEGKKSLAFSITYRFKDRSPLDKDVNELHGRVSETLRVEFGALIR